MLRATRWIGWLMVLAFMVHPFSHAFDCHAHDTEKPVSHTCALCAGAPLVVAAVLAVALTWIQFDYGASLASTIGGCAFVAKQSRAPPFFLS